MGSNVSKLEFSAVFDSGTTYTLLKDPVYTIISRSVSNLNYVFNGIVGITFNTNENDLYPYILFCSSIPKSKKTDTMIRAPALNTVIAQGHLYIWRNLFIIHICFFFPT